MNLTLRSTILLASLAIAATAVTGCSQPAASSPEEQLVIDKCSQCHPAQRALDADKDAAGWKTTIDRMKTNGLSISPEDEAAIIEYLSTK